jgi:hypothetical protein
LIAYRRSRGGDSRHETGFGHQGSIGQDGLSERSTGKNKTPVELFESGTAQGLSASVAASVSSGFVPDVHDIAPWVTVLDLFGNCPFATKYPLCRLILRRGKRICRNPFGRPGAVVIPVSLQVPIGSELFQEASEG